MYRPVAVGYAQLVKNVVSSRTFFFSVKSVKSDEYSNQKINICYHNGRNSCPEDQLKLPGITILSLAHQTQYMENGKL